MRKLKDVFDEAYGDARDKGANISAAIAAANLAVEDYEDLLIAKKDPASSQIRNLLEAPGCPECLGDWQYEVAGNVYSKLIGLEIQGGYDGISYYRCPYCNCTWDRWTGKRVEGKLV